jgi:hypothetical protein
MADLKHSDIRMIDDAFQADAGYVLNFTDRTFAEYFDDEFKINIDERTSVGKSGRQLKHALAR